MSRRHNKGRQLRRLVTLRGTIDMAAGACNTVIAMLISAATGVSAGHHRWLCAYGNMVVATYTPYCACLACHAHRLVLEPIRGCTCSEMYRTDDFQRPRLLWRPETSQGFDISGVPGRSIRLRQFAGTEYQSSIKKKINNDKTKVLFGGDVPLDDRFSNVNLTGNNAKLKWDWMQYLTKAKNETQTKFRGKTADPGSLKDTSPNGNRIPLHGSPYYTDLVPSSTKMQFPFYKDPTLTHNWNYGDYESTTRKTQPSFQKMQPPYQEQYFRDHGSTTIRKLSPLTNVPLLRPRLYHGNHVPPVNRPQFMHTNYWCWFNGRYVSTGTGALLEIPENCVRVACVFDEGTKVAKLETQALVGCKCTYDHFWTTQSPVSSGNWMTTWPASETFESSASNWVAESSVADPGQSSAFGSSSSVVGGSCLT